MTALPRIEYTLREVASMVGRSYDALRHGNEWRKIGGKKRGGRIVFSASAVTAIAEGKK
jgi:hypothetical protein